MTSTTGDGSRLRTPDAGGPEPPARRDGRPLAEVGFVAAGFLAYLAVRWLTLGRTDEAVANAREVLALEEDLGLDWEHGVQTATYAVTPWLGHLATYFYVWAYLPVLVLATTWLYVRHREHYARLRTALLASGVVGLLVYALYPVAPPWITDDRFRDTVSTASLETFARPPGIMNEIGAMPSFHCAWLTLVAVAVFSATRSPVLRAVAMAVPALMYVSVITTGNHWVLDVPAGLALAGLGLLAASAVSTVSTARRQPSPRGQG